MVTWKNEYILSKQILRSGTAIGALIREAEHAESDLDYIHKLSIALKEANETEYWLRLLKETDYLDEKMYESIIIDCHELIKLLVASIKTLKIRKTQKNK
jgi:four helix bundle protein